MAEISLTHTDFKALSSESRTTILKMLAERNYTLSELSAKTGMAAPTVKQHATILAETGLIELRDEGRKWKYYALTRRGRDVLGAQKPQQTNNVLIILGSTIIVAVLGFAILSSNLGYYSSGSLPRTLDVQSEASIVPAPLQAGKELQANATGGTASAQKESCEPTFAVEYVTTPNAGISASEEYAQKCFEADNRQDCEKIDVYSERTNNFGEQDGKADCSWGERSKNLQKPEESDIRRLTK